MIIRYLWFQCENTSSKTSYKTHCRGLKMTKTYIQHVNILRVYRLRRLTYSEKSFGVPQRRTNSDSGKTATKQLIANFSTWSWTHTGRSGGSHNSRWLPRNTFEQKHRGRQRYHSLIPTRWKELDRKLNKLWISLGLMHERDYLHLPRWNKCFCCCCRHDR